MRHEEWIVTTINIGRPLIAYAVVQFRGIGILSSVQGIVHSFADVIREVEVQQFDELADVLRAPPWIEHGDDLVITLRMVADPLPRNQPCLVLVGSLVEHSASSLRCHPTVFA